MLASPQNQLDTVIQDHVADGFAPATLGKYRADFQLWCAFNDLIDASTRKIDAKKARRFCAFLFKYYPKKTGNTISRHLTGVTSILMMHDIAWARPRRVTLLIKAFRKKRPVVSRPKRPWSIYHTVRARIYAVQTFWDLACFAGVMLGWGCLMRCSEFATKSGGRTLRMKQLTMRSREAFLVLNYSKSNQFDKKEVINVPCRCYKHTGRRFGNVRVPRSCCPFHVLKEYLRLRRRHFPKTIGPDQPLLLKSNGYPVSMKNMRAFLKKAILCINKHERFTLDPALYPTHALRVGGTTDMARSGISAHEIESQGRWLTELWKRCYMSNDFRDITLLSGLTVVELKQQSRHPF